MNLSLPDQSATTTRTDHFLEYADVDQVRLDVAELLKPPRRVKVSQAAEDYLRVQLPNTSYGPWDPELTPYLIEPMNCLNSRQYEVVVVVGPARSGKTILIVGWMAYIIVDDPADMMIIHTEKDLARDFSRREIDRSIRNSPMLAERLSSRASDDNTFDKFFKSGNMLTLAWPTVRQLSSRTIKYLAATDYDRRAIDDVNGEGDLLGLMRKRHETFMSAGKSLIETSPGFLVKDPQWKPKTTHEAPPCEGGGGALGFYNQGDRRRRYWQCPACKEYFLANFDYLSWDDDEDPEVAAATVRMECPHCSHKIPQSSRRQLEAKGVWLKEGQTITPDGVIHGEGRRSSIASFWFQGPTACFQTWQSQVLALLRAEREYELTGSEEQLKRTITQDQGRPYIPKAREKDRNWVELMDRAEDLGDRVVPLGVRFLTAAVDVQRGYFDVQVEGWGVGLEHWYVDRFKITKSPDRFDADGHPMMLDPSGYLDDWNVVYNEVMERVYPLGDDPRRFMRIRWVACDSGGEAGVTEVAYKFYRRLRSRGLVGNFMLVKGRPSGPRIEKTYPDSKRRDRKAGARGEIPVFQLNSNLHKDAIDAALSRTDPGPGCSHFPDWFPDWWYKELVSEVKDGERWVQPPGRRNESLDLSVYNRGAMMQCGGESIDWLHPPGWARPWDENTLVFNPTKPQDDPAPAAPGPKFEPEQTSFAAALEQLGKDLG